ncbi:hypothetical protein [Parvibaculum lavamentivorans]|nr:hypothetical protein [Parvibaculum lavamentivorans]
MERAPERNRSGTGITIFAAAGLLLAIALHLWLSLGALTAPQPESAMA